MGGMCGNDCGAVAMLGGGGAMAVFCGVGVGCCSFKIAIYRQWLLVEWSCMLTSNGEVRRRFSVFRPLGLRRRRQAGNVVCGLRRSVVGYCECLGGDSSMERGDAFANALMVSRA